MQTSAVGTSAVGILTGAVPAALPSAGAAPGAAPGEGTASFGDVLKNAIAGVDDLEQQATSAVGGLLAGQGVDIHDAMIATQKADLSFEMALEVRNKAVAAYQQVMGMQF